MKFAKGLAFPFSKSNSSFPAESEDEVLVRQSLEQILGVAPRERVMRPDFGCLANSYVFESNDELLPELLASEIRAAVTQNEPRVMITAVTAERNDAEIVVTIEYIVTPSRKEQSLQIVYSL